MSRIPKMSARKLARFRSENAGAYPRSTIQRKEKLCTNTSAHSVKEIGNARLRKTLTASFQKNSPAKRAEKKFYRASKPIPSRKKRSTTPIRSTPFEGRLDKRSHWTASGNLKLYGADKEAMRARIFERAGIATRCEDKAFMERRCIYRATEWSHKPCIHIKVGSGHGQGFKCDSELCGAAECGRCHRKSHGQY